MRASISCSSCWQCSRKKLHCHEHFAVPQLREIITTLLERERPTLPAACDLLLTGRGAHGLYTLYPQAPGQPHAARICLDQFWQVAFLHFSAHAPVQKLEETARKLLKTSPPIVISLRSSLKRLLLALNACIRKKKPLPEDFWKSYPAHSRLFAGFIDMDLQNNNFSMASLRENLARIGLLEEVFSSIS